MHINSDKATAKLGTSLLVDRPFQSSLRTTKSPRFAEGPRSVAASTAKASSVAFSNILSARRQSH